MDKKGQTLIIFVIMIPIIITIAALVVDVGMLTHEFQKARGILDDGIKEYFESNDLSEIQKMLELNGIPVTNLEIFQNENIVEVKLNYSISSLFGNIIHLTHYDIEIHRVGKKIEEKIIITKKE